MGQNGLSRCPYWCSNHFPPLQTQNAPSGLICVAKKSFLAYICPFLAPVGPHFGHSGSGKWPKLINLDVLSVVPTSFQPVPLNRGSRMAIFLKMLFSSLKLEHRPEHIVGPKKTIDASNGTLLKNAYHISQCGGCHPNWCLYLKKRLAEIGSNFV